MQHPRIVNRFALFCYRKQAVASLDSVSPIRIIGHGRKIVMQTESQIISVNHNGTKLLGHLFSDAESKDPRPAVIVCHAWAGCDAFALKQAETMASLGYAGFAADLYGEGRVGTSTEENAELMQPLVENRGLLRERLRTIFNAVCELPGCHHLLRPPRLLRCLRRAPRRLLLLSLSFSSLRTSWAQPLPLSRSS